LQASGISGGKIASDSQGGGIGRSVGGFIDPKLNWSDISWLRKHTKLPIGLKGIQSVEDAKRAMELGVDAIYLSNHGLVLPPLFRCVFFLGLFHFQSPSFAFEGLCLAPNSTGRWRYGSMTDYQW